MDEPLFEDVDDPGLSGAAGAPPQPAATKPHKITNAACTTLIVRTIVDGLQDRRGFETRDSRETRLGHGLGHGSSRLAIDRAASRHGADERATVTTTDLDAGVLLTRATAPSGTRTFPSGKYVAQHPLGIA